MDVTKTVDLKSLAKLWAQSPIVPGVVAQWAKRNQIDAEGYFATVLSEIYHKVPDGKDFLRDSITLAVYLEYDARDVVLNVAGKSDKIHRSEDFVAIADVICELNRQYWHLDTAWLVGAFSDRPRIADEIRTRLAIPENTNLASVEVASKIPKVKATHRQIASTASTAPKPKEQRVDFLLVAPLEDERDAILRLLPNAKKLLPNEDDNRVYYSATLETVASGGEGSYRIVVVPLVGMGTNQAAVTTVDAIRQWSPRYVIVIGVAGGVASAGVSLGDVLVANQVADYSVQKHRSNKVDIRWDASQVDTGLLERARNFPSDWHKSIVVARPGVGLPCRHIGPIASGDHVIASKKALATYIEPWSKLIGVEMEAAGVARALSQSKQKPGFFMVRGVSDLADAKKNSPAVKEWRAYACGVAAAYAIEFLKSGPVSLSDSVT